MKYIVSVAIAVLVLSAGILLHRHRADVRDVAIAVANITVEQALSWALKGTLEACHDHAVQGELGLDEKSCAKMIRENDLRCSSEARRKWPEKLKKYSEGATIAEFYVACVFADAQQNGPIDLLKADGPVGPLPHDER